MPAKITEKLLWIVLSEKMFLTFFHYSKEAFCFLVKARNNDFRKEVT